MRPNIPTSKNNDPSNLAHPKDLKGSIDVDVILIYFVASQHRLGIPIIDFDEQILKKQVLQPIWGTPKTCRFLHIKRLKCKQKYTQMVLVPLFLKL